MLKFQYFTPAALIREGFLTFFLFATTAQNFRHRSNAASNDVFMNTASTFFVISFLYCSSLPRIILGRPQILPNQNQRIWFAVRFSIIYIQTNVMPLSTVECAICFWYFCRVLSARCWRLHFKQLTCNRICLSCRDVIRLSFARLGGTLELARLFSRVIISGRCETAVQSVLRRGDKLAWSFI